MLRLPASLRGELCLIGSAVGFGGRLIADCTGPLDLPAAISRASDPKPAVSSVALAKEEADQAESYSKRSR